MGRGTEDDAFDDNRSWMGRGTGAFRGGAFNYKGYRTRTRDSKHDTGYARHGIASTVRIPRTVGIPRRVRKDVACQYN